MTVKQFKELINRIPENLDEYIILLPEGIHSSQNINWLVDQEECDSRDTCCVIIRCE